VAIYDFRRGPSNQKRAFAKMEHFKRVPIKKQTSSYRYPYSEQYGLTLGFVKLRHAWFIRFTWAF